MRTLIDCRLAARAPAARPRAGAHPLSAPAPRSTSSAPKNGATVHTPVLVQFGLKGMGIAPAGIKFDNSGHHHLLIDTDPPADLSAPLPATDKIVHFGKGQTETTLDADARQAHPAAAVRRPEPHPAQPAGDVEEDHHHRGAVTRSPH